jgi:hypothetical protein
MGLESLRQGLSVDIDTEETAAILETAQELELLSEASQLPAGAQAQATGPEVRRSFYTLVAIAQDRPTPAAPPELDRVGSELRQIHGKLVSQRAAEIELSSVERAQKLCLELLENLNTRRRKASL